ncbi:MAG: hypothetical protein JNJ57_19140 [Saprospiraceae bacterium]|nr:hypothetical protein [Saprospiraceae bacterium]
MEVIFTHNYQPDLLVWGVRMGEPVVALTGLMITFFAVYAWRRLTKAPLQDDVTRLSRFFFLFTGVSTLISAVVGHIFLYALPFAYKLPGWMSGIIAISAFEQASIVHARPFTGHRLSKALTWFNILKLTVAVWLIWSTLWFPCVEIHAALGFLCIIGPLEAYRWLKKGLKSGRKMWLGIACLFFAVLTHLLEISISKWFGYFDIAHLIMCGAIWFFMLGVEAGAKERLKSIEGDANPG